MSWRTWRSGTHAPSCSGASSSETSPFVPDDDEPEDVDWINDSTKPLIEAIEPRAAAELALRLAEETDALVAALPPERMYPQDTESPLNAFRSAHRAEHLDQIEAMLRGSP